MQYGDLGTIAIVILLGIMFVWALRMESGDRKKIPDNPDCTMITSYCNDYGQKNNIKYVIKDPIDKSQTVDLLLDRIENAHERTSHLVYWRMSLIVSFMVVIFYYLFNRLSGYQVNMGSYIFLLVIIWSFGYWMRNYLDFHYHQHTIEHVKDTVGIIKQHLRSSTNN